MQWALLSLAKDHQNKFLGFFAKEMGVSTLQITLLAGDLEDLRFIALERNPIDKRSYFIKLTGHGNSILEDLA